MKEMPPAYPASPPRGLIALLILVVSMGPLALAAFVPALPVIAAHFSAEMSVAQLALSLSMLSIAVTTLAYGPLSDRFGRRPVLIISFLIGLIGSTAGWLAQDLSGVILGRVVQAAGIASGMVVARAIVQDVYGTKRMASVMGWITGAMVAAPLLGPFIGGILVDLAGWRWVFGFIAICLIGLILVMLWRLPETHHSRGGRLSMAALNRDFGGLMRNKDFLRFSLYVVMAQSGLLTFIGGAPLIVQEVYGHPASAYGAYVAVMAVGYMIGSLSAGRLGLVLAGGGMMWVGTSLAIFGLGLSLILALAQVPDLIFLAIAIAVGAAGVGFALPAAQTGFVAAAPQIAGSASSLSGFLQMLMLALSTQFVGMVQTDESAIPTVATMFIMVLLAPLCLLVIQPRNPQAPAFFQRQTA